jgi:acyl dehydratase
VARNTDTASANKIHDDTVARQYGFAGGLVPGVVVHAYLTHPPVEQWGLEWIARGAISARFNQPVYDGEAIEVVATDDVTLAVRKTSGGDAAVAHVGPPDGRLAPPDAADWPHRPLPPRAERPRASAEFFAATPVLGALDVGFHAEMAQAYLEAVNETLPVYGDEGVAHPGWLIAQANYVLSANVVLGPWIHVESEVRHFGLVRDGDTVSTRARVNSTFERRGHRFVELDVLILTDRPVLRARHVAIYEPRPVAG